MKKSKTILIILVIEIFSVGGLFGQISPFLGNILSENFIFDQPGEYNIQLILKYIDVNGNEQVMVINKGLDGGPKKVIVLEEGAYQFIGFIMAYFLNPIQMIVEDDPETNQFKLSAEITYAAVGNKDKGELWGGILPGSVYAIIDFGDGQIGRPILFDSPDFPALLDYPGTPPGPARQPWNWGDGSTFLVDLTKFPKSTSDSYKYTETKFYTEHIYTVPNFPNNVEPSTYLESIIPTPYPIKAYVHAKFIKFTNIDINTNTVKYNIFDLPKINVIWPQAAGNAGVLVIDNTPPTVDRIFLVSNGIEIDTESANPSILRVTTGEKFKIATEIDDNNPKAHLSSVKLKYGFLDIEPPLNFQVLNFQEVSNDLKENPYEGRIHLWKTDNFLNLPPKFATKTSIKYKGKTNLPIYSYIEAMDSAQIKDALSFLIDYEGTANKEGLVEIPIVDNDPPSVSISIKSLRFNFKTTYSIIENLNDKVIGSSLHDRDFGKLTLKKNNKIINLPIKDPEKNPKTEDEIKVWLKEFPKIVLPKTFLIEVPEDTRIFFEISLTENTVDKECEIYLQIDNGEVKSLKGLKASFPFLFRTPTPAGKTKYLKIWVMDGVFKDRILGKMRACRSVAIPFKVLNTVMFNQSLKN